MQDSYVAGSQLTLGLAPGETKSDLLRRAVGALGQFGGADFQPRGARSTRFLRGEGEATTVGLAHPAHPALNSWIRVSLGDFEPNGIGVTFLTVHLDEPGCMLELEWQLAMSLTTRLVIGLKPYLAHLTAWHLEGYGEIFPTRSLRPVSRLPDEFGPWTYISAEELSDQVCNRLAALPVYASQALGGGWLVRVVKSPGEEPVGLLRDALRRLDTEPITYRPARLAAS